MELRVPLSTAHSLRTNSYSLFKLPKTPKAAIQLQNKLRKKVCLKPLHKKIRVLAGFDLAFLSKKKAVAGVVLFEWPGMKEMNRLSCKAPVSFPYIPGLLAFREIPALLVLWKRIKRKPDLIFIDGQGIAHPRQLGIASHFGLLIKRPTIGVAKSRLVGEFKNPAQRKGSASSLKHKGKVVGSVLRTQNHIKPIFVSPGHLINLQDSIRWTLAVRGKYRIPEPTRQADIYVNKLKKLAAVNSQLSAAES